MPRAAPKNSARFNFAPRRVMQPSVLSSSSAQAASRICFVVGFGLESNNPDRPENWSEGVEKFTWYCFAFVGAMAVALVILHVVQKQTSGLAWSLFFTVRLHPLGRLSTIRMVLIALAPTPFWSLSCAARELARVRVVRRRRRRVAWRQRVQHRSARASGR